MAAKTEKAAETEKTAETAYNPWEDMRKITLPRARKGEDVTQYVGINGRAFYVPRNGREQEVPYPVYEALVQLQAAEEADEDFRANEIPHEVVPTGSDIRYFGL